MLKILSRNFKATVPAILISVSLWAASCSSSPTNLRALAPSETLIYLETNNLGAALRSVFESRPIKESAVKVPDLSVLDGVQAAVAITGFEMQEQKLTEEQSVGKVMPKFALIADTHKWNYQARAFAEAKFGAFVADIYGSEPKLEKSEKAGGSYFAWTAADGRKAFALVIDGLIYFGNDEGLIDHCIAVRKGEGTAFDAKSLHPSAPTDLAYGYISPDGMAQIANVLGVRLAAESTEEGEVRSAIAGILPKLIRGAVKDVHWTTKKKDDKIEDRWEIDMPNEVAAVFAETMTPADGQADASLAALIPASARSATIYNLKTPQVAWRSVVLTAEHLSDPFTARVFSEIGTALFEPYGIGEPEKFLSSIDGRIVTVSLAEDQAAAIVKPSTNGQLQGLLPELDPAAKKQGDAETLDVAVQYTGNLAVVGEKDTVSACVAGGARSDIADVLFAADPGSVSTISKDDAAIKAIASFLGDERTANRANVFSLSRTDFSKSGVVRTTTSDLGFIGQIIAMLSDDN
ncbi:MAG: hypothetical protein JSS77_06050 [Acidobacteria bacterium]|nr:hypothetical protein [Acidobacteriota bacterium]